MRLRIPTAFVLAIAAAGIVSCGAERDLGPTDQSTSDAGVSVDAGASDAGSGSERDGGTQPGGDDAGPTDAGSPDAGLDAGPMDAGAPDAGRDAGMASDGGACTNPSDTAALNQPNESTAIANCAQNNINYTTLMLKEPQTLQCIQNTGLSSECALCIDANANCTIQHCLTQCISGVSAGCTSCRATWCDAALLECAGVAPS